MDGDRLGHFSLLEKIGEGGMGRVYKARDSRLDRFVAIKLLPEGRLTDPDRRARFFQEARAASGLNHPNIITVHEIGEQDAQTFIVMELVEGKPLNDLIPRKGMRLTDALRIAAQIADALTAAHAAGIVHRDLKPANIMVDSHGRVKVLDFGLAKLPTAIATAPNDATQTLTAAQPRTEEGVVLGSIPYMSPEQAEGKPVDARSDIFSFGAVLYEMVTGRRAFQGESRASTLAAVVEKEPDSISSISESVPPELERLIARCLRKDVARRSQHMADVKLALEELRDESESGKLTRPSAVQPVAPRQWLWAAIAVAAVAVALAALWISTRRRGPALTSSELIRISPDDGHAYGVGSLSPDGKFIADVSDRSGKRELWLQQVAGGDPIQLTHEKGDVIGARFFPDGARLLFATEASDGMSTIAVIPTLGGTPRVLSTANHVLGGDLSHDGRHAVYFENEGGRSRPRMMVTALEGGQPRELTAWRKIQPALTYMAAAAWTSDDRYLLSAGVAHPDASFASEGEWFAIPLDGGDPKPTGAGAAMRAAGLKFALPGQVEGRFGSGGADRILFAGGKSEHTNIWEMRLSLDSMRVRGEPRQLTFGTESQWPSSIAAGMLALNVIKAASDLYLLPLSPETGQPAGILRRLTRDGRMKTPYGVGGNPGRAYFTVFDGNGDRRNDFAVDLETSVQNLVAPGLDGSTSIAISHDGRQVAYTIIEGDRYSLRVGDAGGGRAASRPLCQGCGEVTRFSADGRYLMLQPEARVKPDPKQKYTLRLMDLATGKDRPWLEHPTESILFGGTFGIDSQWVVVRLQTPGTNARRWMIVPWRPDPVPVSEWIEARGVSGTANYSLRGNYFHFYSGEKLMAVRFDPKARSVSDPYEVKLPPDTIKPSDARLLRGPGMVFGRQEFTSSVWMMKLPE